MKITEMTNEQVADTFVRIAAPVSSICDDEQITEILNRYHEQQDTPILKVVGQYLPEIVTLAFSKHRNDLFEIVGALTLQTKEKAAKMKFIETLKVLKEALRDEDLLDFFQSFRPLTKKNEDGSAQG